MDWLVIIQGPISFGGNPNLHGCGSRNIERNFTIVILAVVMVDHHGLGNSSKYTDWQTSD